MEAKSHLEHTQYYSVPPSNALEQMEREAYSQRGKTSMVSYYMNILVFLLFICSPKFIKKKCKIHLVDELLVEII